MRLIKKNYVNWADLVFSNALQHKHDLSVRRFRKIKYSAGFGYLDQNGVIGKSGYQRGSFRLNTDMKSPIGWMGANLSYAKSKD